MFIEIIIIMRLQKYGTRTCHAKQWPTPPSGCYDLDPNGVGVRLLSILWVLSENVCGLIERVFGNIGMQCSLRFVYVQQ